MNIAILNQYKITFKILSINGRKEVQVTSSIIPYFWGYFLKKYPKFLNDEILPEINKALTGQPFDDDGGGSYHF